MFFVFFSIYTQDEFKKKKVHMKHSLEYNETHQTE